MAAGTPVWKALVLLDGHIGRGDGRNGRAAASRAAPAVSGSQPRNNLPLAARNEASTLQPTAPMSCGLLARKRAAPWRAGANVKLTHEMLRFDERL